MRMVSDSLPGAELPMSMLLLPEVMCWQAKKPRAMFPVPVVSVAREFEPTAVLLPPVVRNRELKPTATLSPEVVLRLMALFPLATLPLPVELAGREPDPPDVLE